jgi:FixJ family two-component response regulator
MSRGKVFVIDDDLDVRKAFGLLISAAGYDVETHADAASYLAAAVPATPACIVLDLRMPGVSGLGLMASLAGTERALPFVLVTGNDDVEFRSQALAAGAVDLLSKPVDAALLLGAIERALSLRTS